MDDLKELFYAAFQTYVLNITSLKVIFYEPNLNVVDYVTRQKSEPDQTY